MKSFAKTTLSLGLALLAIAGLGTAAYATAPLAGSAIGNQASATYTDSSNTVRTTTSNIVLTVIQQVASLTLTSSQSKSVAPGGQAVFPHTLINTGNGADTFLLTAASVGGNNFTLTNAAIYADANGDGLPDNAIPIVTTGLLAAGAKFQFVVVGTVPSGATSAQTGAETVTATSVFDLTKSGTNTDTVTAGANAVVQVTQSVSSAVGISPSGPYTFTVTFTNTGNTAATNVTLTDALPASLAYASGTGRWSVSGSTALTDAAGGDPAGIAYDYNITVAGRVTAVISSLAAGQSGTLTFQANIASGIAPGAITNTVGYSYYDGATAAGPFSSNSVQILVALQAAVTFTGDIEASAAQGGTVSFPNVVTNTSLGVDTFNIIVGVSTFPLGTTFRLVKSDGVSAALDSNGDNIPDTGPLAANASFTVIVKATLPAGAVGGPYSVTLTAVSTANPLILATAVDTLTTITTSQMDLMGDVAGLTGVGAGPETNPVISLPVNPGATVRFVLNAKNGSSVADSYALDAATVADFSTLGLPAGWSVVYHDANNAVITKTGVINAGANQVVYADVTIPSGQAPGAQQIYFRALSAVTGAGDRLHDAVTVATVRGLTLVSSNTGQTYPGGAVLYSQTITNVGNVLEGDNISSTVALAATNTTPGWSATVYYDANGNGAIDSNEVAVTDLSFVSNGAAGLAPGESVKLLVKVFAPASATIGAANTTVLTATTTNGTQLIAIPAIIAVSDTTTIILSNLTILKEQALDANGDGVPDTAYSILPITIGAIPGSHICYRVTVTNAGTSPATAVTINDLTPTFTTYDATVPAACTVGGAPTAPSSGSVGAITANVGTLAAGASAVLTFGVKINN